MIDARNWITHLPNEEIISKFSLPGTHNSGARHGIGAKCQTWLIKKQLEKGIRFLDIRCKVRDNKFKLYHGSASQGLEFEKDVLKICYKFLNENKNEFIILSVREEDDDRSIKAKYDQMLRDYVSNGDNSKWYTRDDIPKLSEVRGKIVLVNRSSSYAMSWYKFNIQDSSDIDCDSSSISPIHPHKPIIDWKWKKITDHFKTAQSNTTGKSFMLNFASGYWRCWRHQFSIPDIEAISDKINPKLQKYFKELNHFDWACIVAMDFPTEKTIMEIIEQSLKRFDAFPGYLCRIKSVYHNEFLYAADYKPFDKDRRQIFTWRPGTQVQQDIWRIIPIENNEVYIFNEYQKEYLYAVNSYFDSSRRKVACWRKGSIPDRAIWKLTEYSNDYVEICNKETGEYLYSADYKPFDKDRRRVFTYRSKARVSNGAFLINKL